MSFNGIFFSGERGDDLGQIKIVEIARFTEDDSFCSSNFAVIP